MTRILYHQPTSTLVPYPRDDDGPVVGLDPDYLELTVIQQPQPSYDPTSEQITPTETIDLDALVVTRSWAISPLPPSPPVPDWIDFKSALLASPGVNALLASAIPVAPAAALALPATLLGLSNGGPTGDFARAWAALSTAVPPSAALLAEVIAAATAANLPEEFIALLQAEP